MDFLSSVLLAVFFFIMGAVLVGVIWYLQTTGKGARGKAKANHPSDPNLAEVARMLRNLKTQDLVVELDGKTYRSRAELTAGQQRRLIIAANVLHKWLGLAIPASPAPQAQIAPEPAPSAPPASPAPQVPVAPEPVTPAPVVPPAPITEAYIKPSSAFIAPLMATPEEEVVKPVSTRLPDLVSRVLVPPVPPAPKVMSMAAQIDEVLQRKLVGTPLESRGITVGEVPGQGVEITLDGEKYPGVEAVPDETVRNLIKEAVAEWEKKSREGTR